MCSANFTVGVSFAYAAVGSSSRTSVGGLFILATNAVDNLVETLHLHSPSHEHTIFFRFVQAFLTLVVEGTAGISASAGNDLLKKPAELLQRLGNSLQGIGIDQSPTTLQLSTVLSANIQARAAVTLGYKVASIAAVLTSGYVICIPCHLFFLARSCIAPHLAG